MEQTAKHPILVVTENLRVGGAERYTVLVANELHRRGHRVIVLANDGPFRRHFHRDIRFVRAFFEHGILGILYGAFQMIRISFTERIPLIHAQKLESSRAAWLARFITGVPVVKTAHGYTPKELTYLGDKINAYSDKVVTVVDWLLPELNRNGVQRNKLSVIYNGIPSDFGDGSPVGSAVLRLRLGIGPTDPVVVSTGRIEKGKKYASLIRGFGRVIAQAPSAKLVIVGEGPEKQNLISEVQNLGLKDSVRFVDATTDVLPYLRIANVFCTPSIARGMAVMEAMAAGLPVIGIKPNGMPEVVVDGATGYCIEADNEDIFAERLAYLLKHPERAQAFGTAGRKRVCMHFSDSAMVDALERVYEETLSERARN